MPEAMNQFTQTISEPATVLNISDSEESGDEAGVGKVSRATQSSERWLDLLIEKFQPNLQNITRYINWNFIRICNDRLKKEKMGYIEAKQYVEDMAWMVLASEADSAEWKCIRRQEKVTGVKYPKFFFVQHKEDWIECTGCIPYPGHDLIYDEDDDD
ncbi:non-structural protein 2 [Swine pneumovirus 57]|nr:non-structural protein 2 [Swine pneumovirus 57]